MPADVTLYTTSVCPYCHAAKRLLEKRKIAFHEIDVSQEPEKRAWLVKVTGRRTVPQIFIGAEPIGGYDDLAALDAAGQLAPKLEANAGQTAPSP